MNANDVPRKKRGPYKLYLGDPTKDMPRSTAQDHMRRYLLELSLEEDPCNENQVDPSSSNSSSFHNGVENEDNTYEPNEFEFQLPQDYDTPNDIIPLDNVEVDLRESSDEQDFVDSVDESDERSVNENCAEEDDDVLYNGSVISKKESEILTIATAFRHNLPDIGLDSLLRLIDCHLPHLIFKSKYRFLKRFDFPDTDFNVFYFCKKCTQVFEFGNDKKHKCLSCGFVCKKNDQDGFFLHIPLKNQLQQFLQDKFYLSLRKDCVESDVVNGDRYKQFREQGIIGDNDISIQFNVDGVQFCRSSRKSLWPILVGINELPYRIRKNNLFICGLWYGRKKPPMNLYLRPFVNELINLYEEGITCTPFNSEEEMNIKVHTLFCTVDSVARPTVQNMKQFNGKFGCGYCFQKGERLPNNKRLYRFKRYYNLRTAEKHKSNVKSAMLKKKAVRGVKGPSVLALLPNFHMINCFPPDYLHLWLLGVAKTVWAEWFDSHNSNEPYYLGLKQEEFNRRLLNFFPPSEVTRTPQPIWTGYKANEWKNFVLYNSIVCLQGLLPRKYLNHWQLFVFSLSMLLQNKVTEEGITMCERALETFVDDAEPLYGKNFMRYNIHVLLHTTLFVRMFGALWAWSTFPFENYNGVMKNLFHGTQHIPQQIYKMYTRMRFLNNKAEFFSKPERSEIARNLYMRLMKKSSVHKCLEYGPDLNIFGVGKMRKLTVTEQIIIERIVNHNINDMCQSYLRFVYKGILFHTSQYTRLAKRHNSTALLNDGRIIDMNEIIVITREDSDEMEYIIIGHELVKSNQPMYRNNYCNSSLYSFKTIKTDVLICCRFSSIERKCSYNQYSPDEVYIVPVVNDLETD